MRPKNIEKENAIKSIALQMIAEEGLENFSMQKLAKAANISPRTIYLKYENKDDLLIKLYIEEVLGAYEKAILQDFSEDTPFAEGVKKLWQNGYRYLKNNKHHFALIQHGKASPFLNRAFQQANITEGQFFSPIPAFFKRHAATGLIPKLPFDIYRAMMFAPLLDLVNEYFDYEQRPKQIITEKIIITCCDMVIKSMLNA